MTATYEEISKILNLPSIVTSADNLKHSLKRETLEDLGYTKVDSSNLECCKGRYVLYTYSWTELVFVEEICGDNLRVHTIKRDKDTYYTTRASHIFLITQDRVCI